MASKKELRALITLAGKVDPSLQTAMMKAAGQSAKLSRNFNNSTKSVSKFGSIAKGVFAGNLLATAVTKLASGIARVGKQGLQLASDLTEVQNVVDTTFGEGASKINAWAKQAKNAFGLSKLQAKQFTGTLGAMLKSSGIAGENLLKMSTNLSGLTGDFASFYNLDHDTAFQKIRAGIAGEIDPLRQLGINMSVANLEAFALSKGITTSYKDMDQASQMMLRYSYLMSVSKDAQGDFARTQGEFANQTRLLKTNFQEFAADLMQGAIPGLTKLVQMGNRFLTSMDPQTFSNIFNLVADTVTQLSPLLTDLFKMMTGSLGPALMNILMQILPVVVQIAQTALPLLNEGFMMLMDIIQPLLPDLMQLVQQILPIAAKLIKIVFAVLKPFIPVLLQLAGSLLPPVMQILQALMPFLEAIAPVLSLIANILASHISNILAILMPVVADLVQMLLPPLMELLYSLKPLLEGIAPVLALLSDIIGKVLKKAIEIVMPLLEGFIGIVSKVVGGVSKVIGGIGKFLGLNGKSVDLQANVSSSLKGYAEGGIATKPSIFGEVPGVPEMAIPLKRTPRSLGLLNQTARMLGVSAGRTVNLTYAPVIYGGNRAELEPVLAKHKEEIRLMIEEILNEKERVSYGY